MMLDWIHIGNFYVRPEFQGHRVITAFVQGMLLRTREDGVKTISVAADGLSEAATYWRQKNGLEIVNPDRMFYMENSKE
jgi:GNAT superfamily N-acetyltransferase